MKGRKSLITLILGILYALGPSGNVKQKMLDDAWLDFKRKRMDNQVLIDTLCSRAVEAVARVCSYDENSDFKEGWDYLSPESRSRRSSEQWLKQAAEERRQIPKASFEPTGTGEVFLGEGEDLAVIEVFGINSEFHRDGRVINVKGTVLAGLIKSSQNWYLQSISWYPEQDEGNVVIPE